jgi:hypothetical protein
VTSVPTPPRQTSTPGSSDQDVVAALAEESVVAAVALEQVGVRSADQDVVPQASAGAVAVERALEVVVAGASEEDVGPEAAGQIVGSRGPDDRHRTAQAEDQLVRAAVAVAARGPPLVDVVATGAVADRGGIAPERVGRGRAAVLAKGADARLPDEAIAGAQQTATGRVDHVVAAGRDVPRAGRSPRGGFVPTQEGAGHVDRRGRRRHHPAADIRTVPRHGRRGEDGAAADPDASAAPIRDVPGDRRVSSGELPGGSDPRTAAGPGAVP